MSLDLREKRQFLRIAICVGAISWLLSFLYVASVPLFDDEGFYAYAGAAIGQFLTGHTSFLEMRSAVVGDGWFTPGIPIILAPIYVFDPTPHYVGLRLYASVLTFLLWIWTLREVYIVFGSRYALAIFIFPSLDITWHFLATGTWGDLPSGMLLIIVFGRTWRIAQQIYRGVQIDFGEVLKLEAILLLTFYLRGNSILVVVAVHIFLLAASVLKFRWRLLPYQTMAIISGMVICSAGIAPWSITASRALGGVVISTSTPALSFGVTFGKENRLCFGPCVKLRGNIWNRAANFSRIYAAEQGISQLEAQRRMAIYATHDLTVAEYTRRVRGNFQRFLFKPAGFTQNRFLPRSGLGLSKQTIEMLGTFSAFSTGILYFPFLLALALANGFVVIKGQREQLESLCLKMFTLCLLVQPFVHPGHSRYWPVFAPLMAISGAFLFKMATRDRPEDEPGSAVLVAIQGFYVLVVVTTGVALFLAG